MKKYFLLAGFVLTSGLLMAQNAKLIAEKSGKGAVVMHEVQPKEGLYSLSRIYGVKVADIAAANGFDRDKGLSVGQKVKIPLTTDNLSQKKGKTPVYYSVSEGESLTSISNRFNKISIKDLKSWNKIEGDGVVKGKDLIVGYFTGTAPAVSSDKQADQKSNILGPKSNAKTRQGLITGTNINIRKGPATDQPVIAIAQQDDVVDIIKKINNEWTSVRTKDGLEGYIASQFLKEAEVTAKAELPKKAAPVKTAVVSGTNINIRKGPATNQEVVGVVQQDEVVDVVKEVNSEWASVRTKDGMEGYIASQFLKATTTKAEQPKKAAPVVKTAVVSGTNINVRKGPATDQEVVGVLQQDEVVDIVKEMNSEWTSIRAKDGVEGFVASRFLQPGTVKAAVPEKVTAPTKTAKAYGTRINIRKGPSTDQEVIGLAEEDEVLTYLRKVDNDWSEIRNEGGTTGFVATRFLSFDGKPSVAAIEAEKIALAQAEEAKKIADEAAANERAIAAAQKKDEERKAEAIVSEKITAKNNAAVTDEAGYFKSDFEKYKNSNLISEHTLSSGVFKTDRGWNDGKYYLLMDNAAPGTIVKLTNPDNNQSVYAKVLGKMKGVQYSEGFDIRISEAAATKLKTDNLDKFNVKVMY